ncbi:MAG: FmdB family zinc ribbon protein [Acidobacteriota bacterium]
MPLYEYECGECGDRTETIQKFSDDPLTTCPSCGGGLERLLSAPAIRFKGEGWYVTDYGPKSKKDPSEKSDKSDKADKAEKDSSKKSSTDSGESGKSSSKGSESS